VLRARLAAGDRQEDDDPGDGGATRVVGIQDLGQERTEGEKGVKFESLYSTPSAARAMCVAKVIDGRISAPEQVLRGGCRTDQTASDDAIDPEKRPPVLPQPA
jgi:hypothetical protein